MQAGVDKWEAAGFLGMSVEMLDRVYGHHHPAHLKKAAHAIGYRPQQSLPITLPVTRGATDDPQKTLDLLGGPGRTRTYNQTVMSGGRFFDSYILSAFLSRSVLLEELQDDPIWGETGAVITVASASTEEQESRLWRTPVSAH